MGRPLKKYYFGKAKSNPNTFIGGVAATYGTASAIATKLGISSARISDFSIVGSDIQFRVTGGTYTMPNLCWKDNTAITYYDDRDGLCTSLISQSFRGNSNLIYANFPGVLTILDYVFNGSSAITEIKIPSCTSISSTFALSGINTNCIITANLAALTSNSDSGPLTALRTANCIVNYVGYVDDGSWNTEIKGVAAIDNSRLLIGQRLGCSPASVLNFQIVGSDIRFKVYGTYTLKASAYSSRSDITAFNDNENKVVGFAGSCITYCSNLKALTFNGVTSINFGTQFRNNGTPMTVTMNGLTSCTGSWLIRDNGDVSFNFANLVTMNLTSLTYGVNVVSIYAPKLQTIGSSAIDNGVLGTSIKLNACTITVARFMQTSNSGAEEGDIAYARNSRGSTIVYVD